MAVSTTSLQRTYRYVRIGIAGTVGVILVAVIVASIQMGTVWPSISAYYYSSAGGLFVGALVAAALGILALSGRGTERALLDAAGLLAPLIALIPAPVVPGTLTGYVSCDAATGCTPSIEDRIGVGIVTYVIIGLGVWLVAVLINHRTPRPADVTDTLVLSPLILVLVLVAWLAEPEGFRAGAHLASAGTFFVLIAIVAIRGPLPVDGEYDALPGVRTAYRVLGVLMAIDVAALVLGVITGWPGQLFPWFVLTGEAVALALFGAFWILQSTRKWNEPNPARVPI